MSESTNDRLYVDTTPSEINGMAIHKADLEIITGQDRPFLPTDTHDHFGRNDHANIRHIN